MRASMPELTPMKSGDGRPDREHACAHAVCVRALVMALTLPHCGIGGIGDVTKFSAFCVSFVLFSVRSPNPFCTFLVMPPAAAP
jgi:hypothetical protein